jgi:hypothetical protein
VVSFPLRCESDSELVVCRLLAAVLVDSDMARRTLVF